MQLNHLRRFCKVDVPCDLIVHDGKNMPIWLLPVLHKGAQAGAACFILSLNACTPVRECCTPDYPTVCCL
jgi:hypothetical protein